MIELLWKFFNRDTFRLKQLKVTEDETLLIPEGVVAFWSSVTVEGKFIIHGKVIIGE